MVGNSCNVAVVILTSMKLKLYKNANFNLRNRDSPLRPNLIPALKLNLLVNLMPQLTPALILRCWEKMVRFGKKKPH